MKYLLIGGPADGERHSLPEIMSVYRVAKMSKQSVEEPYGSITTIDYAVYLHFRLSAGAELFDVYAHDSLTPAETLRLLIDCYHPQTDFATLPEK